MSQLTIALPDSISASEARICQAAELAGYSKRTFIELLGKQGIAVVDYPTDELTDDLRHA